MPSSDLLSPTSHSTPPEQVPSKNHAGQGGSVAQEDGQATARVYLIANPITRKSAAWPKILDDLLGRIKGADPAEFADLFTSTEDYRARWSQVVSHLAGAVVIPRPVNGGLMLGLVAVREATEIDAAGKPVLIYTKRRLFRWGQADVKIHDRNRGHLRAELIIPEGAQ